MRRTAIVLTMALVAVAGCAALKQGASDTRAGITAPLAAGEESPMAAGKRIAAPVKDLPIPFAGPIGSGVGILAGLYFANRRGRKIRLAGGVSGQPVTGWAGSITKVEHLVQLLSNISAGIFEVGPEGSPQRRAWKAAVGSLLGTSILMIPGVKDWVTSHGGDPAQLGIAMATVLGLGTAATLGTEKALSLVKPLALPPV